MGCVSPYPVPMPSPWLGARPRPDCPRLPSGGPTCATARPTGSAVVVHDAPWPRVQQEAIRAGPTDRRAPVHQAPDPVPTGEVRRKRAQLGGHVGSWGGGVHTTVSVLQGKPVPWNPVILAPMGLLGGNGQGSDAASCWPSGGFGNIRRGLENVQSGVPEPVGASGCRAYVCSAGWLFRRRFSIGACNGGYHGPVAASLGAGAEGDPAREDEGLGVAGPAARGLSARDSSAPRERA